MIVISDTGPINYLVLIGQADILPSLYRRVTIPQAVFDELGDPDTPEPVRQWIAKRPTWLEVRKPTTLPDSRLKRLDAGERDAILLAEELRADALIMDERKGYLEARRRNLPVLRTLAVLDKAAEKGLVDLPKAIIRLQQTSFRAPARLLEALLERHRRRSNTLSSSPGAPNS